MDAMIQRLAQELERPAHQVENVVHLIDEGNTTFIHHCFIHII